MTTTRTPGITLARDGRFFIDKRYRGVRIGMRIGAVDQEQAEQRLRTEMAQVDLELARQASRPLFADCVARYLMQSQDLRSLEAIRVHVRLLEPYIGHLEPRQVHDTTLAPFISARIAAGASATTINRSLEVVRTILHRAARSYRDDEGRPWLDALPPLITMLPECRRPPYPITWEEQDRLFPMLPAHLARMALFAVNTGLRDSNVCGLQWSWEVPVPEIGRSVFVIPAEAVKTKRPHVVVLNDAAGSIIQTMRGQHPVWVFTYRGRPVRTMNNNGWQQARREVGLPRVRVHDLRHTYACRLRAAGVSAEDRAALLGHATQSMVGHYASADVGRLLRVEARHTHLVVDQSLLVPLAQTGALGGRTYEVFVHALPAVELQRRLDAAARRWPDVASLRDFRVSEAHCVMEAEALRRAQRLVTPHAEVARYLRTTFIGKPVDTIDWLLPPPRAERHARAPEATPVVAFAASALARKGALEMANAMRHLGWRLLVLGSPSSDPRLWHGIEVEHVAYRDRTWLARADVVALPALVEHSPRALLTAIAQGIPVVASPECGLSRSLGAIEVLAGDTAGLIAALLRALGTATKRTNAEARSCLHSRR